jgi:hypothetical protein
LTEREQVLTERLLILIDEQLGQEPGEGSQRVSLGRSPTMLAAWADATSRRRTNGRLRLGLQNRGQSLP